MCKCINIIPQSKECYDQQVVVGIPEHMAVYRDARLSLGLSDTVCIDPCIVDEIQQIWSLGITTYGCCCGHNKFPSFVNVDDKDIKTMIDLGYEHNKTRRGTFKLKSA